MRYTRSSTSLCAYLKHITLLLLFSSLSGLAYAIDSDGDSIDDYSDVDDDNDGIIDNLECAATWADWTIIDPDTDTSGDATITSDFMGSTITLTHTSTLRDPYFNSNATAFLGDLGLYPVAPSLKEVSKLSLADTGSAEYNFSFSSPTTKPIYVHLTAIDKLSMTLMNATIVSLTNGTGLDSNTYTRTDIAGEINEGGFTAIIPVGTSDFSVAAVSSSDNFYMNFSSDCQDFDGDGVSNHLDLDSDNDGSPDALEANPNINHSDLTAKGALAEPVELTETNTLGLPSIAEAGILPGGSVDAAVSAAESDSCDPSSELFSDNDGDGVGNNCDLDNDNDGISDVNECSARTDWLMITPELVGISSLSQTNSITINQDISDSLGLATGSVIVNLENANTNNSATSFGVSVDTSLDMNITGNYPVYLEVYHGPTIIQGESDGFIALDGVSYDFTMPLEPDSTSNQIGTYYFIKNTGSSSINQVMRWESQTPAKSVRLKTTNPNAGFNNGTTLRVSACLDIDNDGIANAFDLDSDNDGSPDALEASDTVNTSDLSTNTSLSSSVETNDLTTIGIPSIAGGGYTVGTAFDDSITAAESDSCDATSELFRDSDGDSIGDDCDVDDDNDGILDTLESSCLANDSLINNFQSIATAAGTTLNGTTQSTSIDGLTLSFSSSIAVPDANFAVYEFSQGSVNFDDAIEVSGDGETVDFVIDFSKPVFGFKHQAYDLDETTSIRAYYEGNMVHATSLDAGSNVQISGNTYSSLLPTTEDDLSNAVTLYYAGLVDQIVISKQSATSFSQHNFIGGCAALDTDGDGVWNSLDIDSDADGSPDILEGNPAINYSDLDDENRFNGTVELTDTNNLGAPILTSVSSIGSSTDANIIAAESDACDSSSELFTDADGDGIGDRCDLDDDNDGIADATECVINENDWHRILPETLGITSTIDDDSLNTSVDVSEEFSLPTGSIIVTIEDGNTAPDASGFAVGGEGLNPLAVNFSGSVPVMTRLRHGSTLREWEDGFIATDNMSYSFALELESGYATSVKANRYFVSGDGTGDGHQNQHWTSDGFATDVIFYSTNPNELLIIRNGVGFELAVCADSDNDGVADSLDLDSDSDGIPDSIELAIDTDLDGTPDYLDLDSDNDQLSDILEAGGEPLDIDGDGQIDELLDTDNDGLADVVDSDNAGTPLLVPDTDSDGVRDFRDLDSDNDTLSDEFEGLIDTDNDGLRDSIDTDSDDDGMLDSIEGTVDSDSDGKPDFRDVDSDNDGISDLIEGLSDTDGDGDRDSIDIDSDSDGIPDATESDNDTDNDGRLDFRDLDSDDDGISDEDEGLSDSDNDGIINAQDDDSDNDGIPDAVETAIDTDDDGTANYLDTDSDDDGMPDSLESSVDSDNDGTADYIDLDSDGDGIVDVIEGIVDTDADGIRDSLDLDSDNDTLPDTLEGIQDVDGDGLPNFRDTDSDGDLIPDSVETTNDADNDHIPDYIDPIDNRLDDSDNDGITDETEGTGDFDGDGVPNYLDTDSDGDGILDATETAADFDRDGQPNFLDLDADNDGALDSLEAHLLAGEVVTDSPRDFDADGRADYLDRDSDNDSLSDTLEAGLTDGNFDGVIDGFVDTDKNGLDDGVDAYPLNELPDLDEDGFWNGNDLDSDNDQLSDLSESQLGDDDNNDGIVDGMEDDDKDGILDNVDIDYTSIINGNVAQDLDGDGIDDRFDSSYILSDDSDGDGVVDAFDNDVDGDGLLDQVYADQQFGTALPDANGDGIPDVQQAGIDYVETGLEGGGCVMRVQSTVIDPSLPLLALLSALGLALSNTRRKNKGSNK